MADELNLPPDLPPEPERKKNVSVVMEKETYKHFMRFRKEAASEYWTKEKDKKRRDGGKRLNKLPWVVFFRATLIVLMNHREEFQQHVEQGIAAWRLTYDKPKFKSITPKDGTRTPEEVKYEEKVDNDIKQLIREENDVNIKNNRDRHGTQSPESQVEVSKYPWSPL